MENYIQERVDSRSMIDRFREGRIVQSIVVIGMVASLSACDVEAIKAGEADACARVEAASPDFTPDELKENNTGCVVDGVVITSENVEMHSALMAPSPEKPAVNSSASSEASIQETVGVCEDLDYRTQQFMHDTQGFQDTLDRTAREEGVTCKVVDGRVVDIRTVDSTDIGVVATATTTTTTVAEAVLPPPPLDSINQAVFEGDYSSLNESQKRVAGAFTLLMNAYGIESQAQLDTIIGAPGWQFVGRPEKSGIRGLTYPIEGQVHIFVREDDTEVLLAGVLAHELGHVIDVASFNTEVRDEYQVAAEQNPNTDYWPNAESPDFDTKAGDFAEAVRVNFQQRIGQPIDDRSTVSPPGNTPAAEAFIDNIFKRR